MYRKRLQQLCMLLAGAVIAAAFLAVLMIVYANLQMVGQIRNSASRFSVWSFAVASQFDPRAAHVLASLRVFALDDPKAQEIGFRELMAEYQDGGVYAAGKLGWAYQRGRGVEADLARAIEFYEVAARGGMTYWQILLSHAYEQGYLGLPQSDQQAAYWREMKPKVHLAVHECWVAAYYGDGTFPGGEARQSQYADACSQSGQRDTRFRDDSPLARIPVTE